MPEIVKSRFNGFDCRRMENGFLNYTKESILKLNYFYREIWYDVHNRDKNFLMVVTGKPGQGKSYGGLRICTMLDPNFDVKRQVIYSPIELMELCRRVENGEFYDGMAVLWEEVGVNYSSKEWFTVINKEISFIIQTMRKNHMILILTVPNKDFLDSTARKLVNVEGKMWSIDRKTKVSRMRIYFSHYESNVPKWYYKKPRITLRKTGEAFIVTNLKLPKVDAITSHQYEKKRAEFIRSLGRQVSNELHTTGNKDKKLDKYQIAKQIIENNVRFRSQKGRIDYVKIMTEFRLPRQTAYDVKKMVENQLGE